ncbi:type II toxin-antitoxin system death-on-curing family toxin [Arthrobacter sp. CJ23]|uniref:type II toxin-antitoxin system death-on-curing family toxin n=1 Tax=Arthrobacter sp. CJ23 TaxID=2972479 RepID=UPI00215D1827|nr:Fic family protein [Arthrobacter sp. CJ23]UVJ41255.1 Fic family protein [Arthrobacter sp. CJ23]
MTAYLDIEDALQVIDRYGFHIRDVGLLASALARPATTVMGAEAYPELAMKAAALLESVARFHPLIDGISAPPGRTWSFCCGSAASGTTSLRTRLSISSWAWLPAART